MRGQIQRLIRETRERASEYQADDLRVYSDLAMHLALNFSPSSTLVLLGQAIHMMATSEHDFEAIHSTLPEVA